MPELPEVETVAAALRQVLPGRTIEKLEVFTPKLRTPLLPLLHAGLEGRVFGAVRRRGRYLILELEGAHAALLVHLGMTGVIRVERGDAPKRKHEHLFLHLSGGLVFRYECVRRFSVVEYRILQDDGEVTGLDFLGAEPLADEFDGKYLFDASRGRRAPVKVFLMDNTVVTGIGNIYCTEALFAAGIDPRRAAETLTRQECATLAKTVKRLLREAIARGGSSIHDYKHVDGSEGSFQLQLAAYGRAGEPCPHCGTVLQSCRQSGRTTVFCPKCQK